jgi:aldehyde dehydrogenase (NAD+)
MNRFQTQFDRHKAYFNSNITKSYEWRIEQLDRLARLLSENSESLLDAICRDFKTATEENLSEITAPLGIIEATKRQLSGWMKPVEAPLPIFLRESRHKGKILGCPVWVVLRVGTSNEKPKMNHNRPLPMVAYDGVLRGCERIGPDFELPI